MDVATIRTCTKGGYPCVSTFPYTDHFKSAVVRFKFNNRRQYAYQMAQMMAATIRREYPEENFDLITYVPLHKERYKERGYNQCELLAKKLSRILGVPAVATLCKIKNTKPQHTMQGTKEREKNVKNAYKIINKDLVKNKKILLIDDIITTGHTLGECAKTLDKHKPSGIFCATFAVSVVKTT